MKPADLKVGPWEIWLHGPAPPDAGGGMQPGSSYRWFRREGASEWHRSEMRAELLVRFLRAVEPIAWLESGSPSALWSMGRGPCPDCRSDELREHEDDCPRGRALQLAGS